MIVIDTSALVAIVFGEPEREVFVDIILRARFSRGPISFLFGDPLSDISPQWTERSKWLKDEMTMENVFSFRDRLIAEYSEFSRSFTRIAAEDIRGEVKRQCDAGRYWPEPLIQCFLDEDRRAYTGWLHEALARERCRMRFYLLMSNPYPSTADAGRDRARAAGADLGRAPRRAARQPHLLTYRHPVGRPLQVLDGSGGNSHAALPALRRAGPRARRHGADPALRRCSSYRANPLGEPDALLTPHALDLGLGDDEDVRRAA